MQTVSLYVRLKSLPDSREKGKVKHDQAEVLTCFIIGTLVGKPSLRRISRWCKRNLEKLRQFMPLENGIASVPTFGRVLGSVDEELLSLTFTTWMSDIIDTRNTHIAIDGKGLRAATKKVRDERTPYVLNAYDVEKQLVIGQMAISEKTNEAGTIPEFLEILDIEGSVVTIDAVGTTERIMDKIRCLGAHFMLQVKKNNPELYAYLIEMFTSLKEEKETNPETFLTKHKDISICSKAERNRERYEYRDVWASSDPDTVNAVRELRQEVNSIGYCQQVRIQKVENRKGEDITPDLEDFLKHGSRKQPHPEISDEADSPIQRVGLISDLELDAEEMASYKRNHWGIENSLHYILDDVLREDKSTIRKGKANAALLRKIAYNIIRMWIIRNEKDDPELTFTYAVDDLAADWEVIAEFIFNPVKPF